MKRLAALFLACAASPAFADEMPGMDMPMDHTMPGTPEHMMPRMTMTGALGGYPMTRDASGTSWQPDLAEHHGIHLMAGDCDFLLRVAVADLDAYRQFQIQHLNRIAGVQNTKTEIPMQRIKQTTELPV